MSTSRPYDVIVVGGGPAGSVMGWSLAQRGVHVAIVDRDHFPREKVCGDYVEPGGLRILEHIGCRQAVVSSSSLPIQSTTIYVRSEIAYQGPIPYYDGERQPPKPDDASQERAKHDLSTQGPPSHDLPGYGLVVPRRELDSHLIESAAKASAAVIEGHLATAARRHGDLVEVDLRSSGRKSTLRSRLVVGADGSQSVIAKSFGLLNNDRRSISVSQRGYVEGVSLDRGEAAIFFDDDLFPGYGWMFPMSGGRANVGVGVLSEACDRYGMSIPAIYQSFVRRLREVHPGCADLLEVGKPLGGMVKMYGSAGANHFDGGLLIGEAGSFVDPMTGEGITPAMESALLGARTVMSALENSRTDAEFLSRYERDFRAYFDPAMCFLDLCACMLRNRHFGDFWLSSARRMFLEAKENPDFARVAGSTFGGVGVQALPILGHVLGAGLAYFGEGAAQLGLSLLGERSPRRGAWLADAARWQRALWKSMLDDPRWHLSWTADLLSKATAARLHDGNAANPRVAGLL